MTSLRWRTAAAFAVLSAVIATIMSIVVYRTSVDQQTTRLRALAVQQARAAATIYGATGALVGDATVNDPSAPRALRHAVGAGHDGSQLVSRGGALTVWGGSPVGTVTVRGVYVSASGAAELHSLNALRATLLLTSGAMILAGALGGTIVASRLSRRLRDAASAARAIAGGELRTRIATGGADEVGVLSDAVDAMADALGARIERERRFNADVAHELRTPVTGLLAASDLLPEDDQVSAMIRDRARRLHRLVEDLLEISRLESGRETADVRSLDLRPFADDLAARYPGVTVTGELRIETDPRRLERVVVNLLENAIAHGAPPIGIELTPGEIAVTDSGAGFPRQLDESLLKRHVTHTSRGHGLGLSIAYEQARVLGARLTLDNPDGGGARASVRWPR